MTSLAWRHLVLVRELFQQSEALGIALLLAADPAAQFNALQDASNVSRQKAATHQAAQCCRAMCTQCGRTRGRSGWIGSSGGSTRSAPSTSIQACAGAMGVGQWVVWAD